MQKPKIHLLELKQETILQQLQLEEALLRADERNWCIINQKAPPAIVLGISGNPQLLVNQPLYQTAPVPLIRRFSGGGTVFIDENTHFVTFICNSDQLNVPCFPDKVFKWTEHFYQPLFKHLKFQLLENDYVLENKKFGGNAQYMRKNRWLHHSSFLWDYSAENMKYLLMPPKTPAYRERREHSEFLCSLQNHFSSRHEFNLRIFENLEDFFNVERIEKNKCLEILRQPHRQATTCVDLV
jgi:lipoate---protein ligase